MTSARKSSASWEIFTGVKSLVKLAPAIDLYVHEVAVGCEFGDECRGGKAYAGDTAVVAFGGPASAAAVGRELLRGVLASFLDECGFERFELFVFLGDVAVKCDGFGDEFAERDFVHLMYFWFRQTAVLNAQRCVTWRALLPDSFASFSRPAVCSLPFVLSYSPNAFPGSALTCGNC